MRKPGTDSTTSTGDLPRYCRGIVGHGRAGGAPEEQLPQTQGRNSEQDRTKRWFLNEWTRATNHDCGSGRSSRDVSDDPGDIKDILGRHKAGGELVEY